TKKQVLQIFGGRVTLSAEVAEVVRILSLNRTYDAWRGKTLSDTDDLVFTAISPTGYRNHADSESIKTLASECFHRLTKISTLETMHNLNSHRAVDVLGSIHSIGSHTLPPRGFSVKRLMGAFYTPADIALFISKRTIGPVLDSVISESEGDADSAISQILKMRFLDPCCGPGIFLICAFEIVRNTMQEFLERSKSESSKSFDQLLASLVQNLHGVDLDPASLEIADVCLRYISTASVTSRKARKYAAQLRDGNSIISLQGMSGTKDHNHFFKSGPARHPFEWPNEFRTALNDGGFDFVLFNPPYERLKPNLSEFMRENLRAGHSEINLKEFDTYKTLIAEDVEYYRKSGEFNHSTSSSINTYQLFIERALQTAKMGGRIGFIVPSTLLGDYSSRIMREHLLTENTLDTIDSFTESARLFPGVTQAVCIAALQKGGRSENFTFLHDLESIQSAQSNLGYKLALDDVLQTFGQSFVVPRIESNDWLILKRMHSHPPLSTFSWMYNRRGEFDLTFDKKHMEPNKGTVKLIRGSEIGRYHKLPKSKRHQRQYVDIQSFRFAKKNSRRLAHINQERIACQQVSNQVNQWRLKFCRIESGSVLANSCNYIALEIGYEPQLLAYLLGILNSELLNWRFSVSSTNNHVSNREIALLPIVNPLDDNNANLVSEISKEVKQIKRPLTELNPRLESLVFRLYGLSKNEVRRVMKRRNRTTSSIDEIVDSL
ncbi:MAG: Eco57I restriction-modification methylase domain-containing protein, partial [Candidatus Thorarchaeota archaeon]|nr:Eco57I restriction-modification methylase domain-containing protein [Candidatus Thorarchaeota archaeon]